MARPLSVHSSLGKRYTCTSVWPFFTAFDDLDGAMNGLLVGNARRLPEAVDQRVLLGIALGELPRMLGCLFRLRERKLFHVIAFARQQLVGFALHGSPNSYGYAGEDSRLPP